MPPCGSVTGSSRSCPTGTVKSCGSPPSIEIRSCACAPAPVGHRALILDPQGQRHLLAEDGEGRRVLDDQPPVPVVRCARSAARAAAPAGPARARCRGAWPSVSRIAPASRRARLLGQRLGQRGHQQRAAVVLGVGQTRPRAARCSGSAATSALDRRDGARSVCAGRSPMPLAGAVDRPPAMTMSRQRVAVLVLQRRVGDGRQQRRRRQRRAATSPTARARAASADERQRQRRAPPRPAASGSSGSKITICLRRCSLPQPVEQRGHVDLVGFVVAGQHMHDEVHAEAVGDLALPLAGIAAPDREQRRAAASSTAQAAAQSLPPITTGVTLSLRLRNGIPSTCSASGGAASTQTSRPA